MLVSSIFLLITILLFPLIRYFHKQLRWDQFRRKCQAIFPSAVPINFVLPWKTFWQTFCRTHYCLQIKSNCNLFHTWGNTHNRTFLSYYVFFVFNRFIGVQTLLVFALSLNNAIILSNKLNFSQVRSKFLELALRLIFLAKLMRKVRRWQWIY